MELYGLSLFYVELLYFFVCDVVVARFLNVFLYVVYDVIYDGDDGKNDDE